MKAITCPQCGSLITKISAHHTIVECDYCGAIVTISDRFPIIEPFEMEAAKFRAPELPARPKTPAQPIFIAISLIGTFVFVLFIGALISGK